MKKQVILVKADIKKFGNNKEELQKFVAQMTNSIKETLKQDVPLLIYDHDIITDISVIELDNNNNI